MAIDLVEGSFDALIFDCDGTLVDTAPAHYSALSAALRKHDLHMDSEWYFERVGLAPKNLLDAYEEAYGTLPVSRATLLEPYTEAFLKSLHEIQEITVVADVARTWKGRVPMSVASNGQRENVKGSLGSAGLLPFFDYVIGIEDVNHGKPEPDIFLEAARRMAVDPTRCIVLEDSDEGLAGARAAGMRGIDIRETWTPEWKIQR